MEEKWDFGVPADLKTVVVKWDMSSWSWKG
jgi:hypothetical protein